MRPFRKFQRNLQDYGPGTAVRKAFMYLFRWLYHACDYRIYCIDLRAWKPPPLPDGPLEFRLLGPSDEQVIREIEDMEEWLHGKVAPILRADGLCLVAMSAGKMVGFNLVGFGRLHIPAIYQVRTFHPHTAWSVQISVSPDFRGRSLASELRHRVFVELQKRGAARFYGGTMTDNAASLRSARKSGFHEVVDIRFRRYLAFSTWRYVRIKPSP